MNVNLNPTTAANWIEFHWGRPNVTTKLLLLWGKDRKPTTARLREDGMIEELYSGKLWYCNQCPFSHWTYIDEPSTQS